jgi:hypothetical protein
MNPEKLKDGETKDGHLIHSEYGKREGSEELPQPFAVFIGKSETVLRYRRLRMALKERGMNVVA